jgi:hypothetical protein
MTESLVGSDQSQSKRPRMSVKTFLIILVTIYVILVVTGRIGAAEKLGPSEYALIAFVVLFVGDFVDKLAELSFGKDGLTVRLNTVEARQKQADDTLKAIEIALTGLVNKYEYVHLQKLGGLLPDGFRYGHVFFDEIRRLDSMGFVRPIQDRGFNAIKEDHEHNPGEFSLRQYVKITDEGKAYLTIRKRMEAEDLVRRPASNSVAAIPGH